MSDKNTSPYDWSRDMARLQHLLQAGCTVIYRHGPTNLLEIKPEDGRINLNSGSRFGDQYVSIEDFVKLFERLGYEFIDPVNEPGPAGMMRMLSHAVGMVYANGVCELTEDGDRCISLENCIGDQSYWETVRELINSGRLKDHSRYKHGYFDFHVLFSKEYERDYEEDDGCWVLYIEHIELIETTKPQPRIISDDPDDLPF